MKEVLISIKSSQIIPGSNDTDSIELTTLGKMGQKDGAIYLSYDESKSIGIDNVKTILRVESNNLVSLTRSGGIGGRLVVENRKRNVCCYTIPQGSMTVGIYGKKIENSLTKNGGRLFMNYTIDTNANLVSENKVEITVKEVN